jgi:large subunit ribosomal protein L22
MEVRAITKMVRISAFKAREVTRQIQGLTVADAMDVLRFSPLKAARLVTKTLKSAAANAENNNGLSVGNLFVKEAVVGEGPTFRRFQAAPRGSALPIRKRTSHIKITVAEREEQAEKKGGKKAKAASEKKAPKAKAKTTKTTEK